MSYDKKISGDPSLISLKVFASFNSIGLAFFLIGRRLFRYFTSAAVFDLASPMNSAQALRSVTYCGLVAPGQVVLRMPCASGKRNLQFKLFAGLLYSFDVNFSSRFRLFELFPIDSFLIVADEDSR